MLYIMFLFSVLPMILTINPDFAVKYFRGRNLSFICLISCKNVIWDSEFTKAASARSMSVSRLSSDDLSDENVKQCFRQHFSTIGVLINSQCGNAEQIFNTASENMWLDSKHNWLIVDEDDYQNESIVNSTHNKLSENIPKTIQMLENLNISVDADIIVAFQKGNNFILFDVFNFGRVKGGSLVVTKVGLWDNHESGNKLLVAELNRCKYYKRWDFGQMPMRIMSVVISPPPNFDPKSLTDRLPVPGVSTITRTSTMALMEVAEIHNIKFVHTISDRWLGTYEKNSTRAVVTSLFFREQDLTSVLRLYTHLFDKITFIHPSLTSLETRYYYRIPTTGLGKYENQFFRPLSTGTWLCVLGVSALCAVILIFAARLEARPSSVQYALFSVIASVCQQFFEDDSQTSRSSAARKLIIFITGVSCVLIYNYYTSSVVSRLLNGPPPSINSLQELLQSPLELIYQDVGYTRSWLYTPGYYYNRRNAKIEDEIRRNVLKKKKITSVIKSLDEGIAMVKAGGYAYHTDTDSADTLISKMFDQNEICELGSLTSMEKTLLYPGVQKDSPYREFLTWSLTRLLERGIVSCIQRRTIRRPVVCDGSSPRALALGGAAPAFILLAFGFLLGTIIMLVERYIYKIKQRTLH